MQSKEDRLLHSPHVLAITDLTSGSVVSLCAADEWCRKTGGKLTVLYTSPVTEDNVREIHADARHYRELHQQVEEQIRTLGIKGMTIVRYGVQKEVLSEVIQEMNYDLVVLGHEYVVKSSIGVADLSAPAMIIHRPLGPKTLLLVHPNEDVSRSLRFYAHFQSIFSRSGEVLCLIPDHPGLYGGSMKANSAEIITIERDLIERKRDMLQRLEKHSPPHSTWGRKVMHSREPSFCEHLEEVVNDEKSDLCIFRSCFSGVDHLRHSFTEALVLARAGRQNVLVLN